MIYPPAELTGYLKFVDSHSIEASFGQLTLKSPHRLSRDSRNPCNLRNLWIKKGY